MLAQSGIRVLVRKGVIAPQALAKHLPLEASCIEGYSQIRKDRTDRKGGGVAIYIKNDIASRPLDLVVPGELECAWVHLRPKRLPREVSSLALCAVYNPPASPHEGVLLEHLSESIDMLRNSHPDIGSPVGRSDHACVIMPGKHRQTSNTVRKKVVRPMRDSDSRAFGSWITTHSWDEVLLATSAESKCDAFYSTLKCAVDKYFPTKVVRLHCRDKPWVTPCIKALIAKRQKAFHKGDTSAWKRYRNRFIREISTAKRNHYRDKVEHLKTSDPKEWYRNIKDMTGIRRDQGNQILGVNNTNPKEAANAINTHLAAASQQFPPLSLDELPSFLPACTPPPVVTVWDMYHQLRKVKVGKASGVDNISSRLVREFAFELSSPMTDIFNTSLAEGSVPSIWKKANVVPVPKENPPRLDKLRPISLTSIFAKICEGFVTRWCLQDILPNIDNRQFGSLRGKSTTHCLTSLVHSLACATDKPGHVSTLVLTDFTRAFDQGHHLTAMNKLLELGVRRSILPWVCNFLSLRQQRVTYKGTLSEWETLTCGVPQGTKLGPLVFLALINDAAPQDDTSAEAWKYVDDMSLAEARLASHPSKFLQFSATDV
ncbi:uncharacterized protein LOC118423375 [Branchiostoma floridae]|uniref:Uncharacterized protein LOC118423375 n=1 Tax=Branchiostoma floridae TaxID=7739 RepID=A0A9J7N115_BRAFL|nr:uncharacterized protein LOC118423375 [Branchiostoma floridae]